MYSNSNIVFPNRLLTSEIKVSVLRKWHNICNSLSLMNVRRNSSLWETDTFNIILHLSERPMKVTITKVLIII